MNKLIIAILSFLMGIALSIFLLGAYLSQLNENTITFQTDSPWFNDCKGTDYGDFIFIFGTMDCEDIGLEQYALDKQGEKDGKE